MQLTKQLLTQMIDEELKTLSIRIKKEAQKPKQKQTRRQHLDSLFAGYDDFKKLSLGITENELDEMIDDEIEEIKKKKPAKNCQGNPFRDENGKYTNPDNEPYGSWINMKPDCEKRGKLRRRGKKQMFTNLPCGRNSKYRCKDGTEKEYYE